MIGLSGVLSCIESAAPSLVSALLASFADFYCGYIASPDQTGKSFMCDGRQNDLVKNATKSLLTSGNGKVDKIAEKGHNPSFGGFLSLGRLMSCSAII